MWFPHDPPQIAAPLLSSNEREQIELFVVTDQIGNLVTKFSQEMLKELSLIYKVKVTL